MTTVEADATKAGLIMNARMRSSILSELAWMAWYYREKGSDLGKRYSSAG